MPTTPSFRVDAGVSLIERQLKDQEERLELDAREEILDRLKKLLAELEALFAEKKNSNDISIEFLSQFISLLQDFTKIAEEISKYLLPESQKEVLSKAREDINRFLSILRQMQLQLLSFNETGPLTSNQERADLATANRLDPNGQVVNLQAAAEVHRTEFLSKIKDSVRQIAEQLLEIATQAKAKLEKDAERNNYELLLASLNEFNQQLTEVNQAADEQVLTGIISFLFKNTIGYNKDRRMTIMRFCCDLPENKGNTVEGILAKIIENRDLLNEFLNFIQRIPVDRSLDDETKNKYNDLWSLLLSLDPKPGLKGKKVRIVLRDTKKLSYLQTLLDIFKKINSGQGLGKESLEQQILNAFNSENQKQKGSIRVSIDDFKKALELLVYVLVYVAESNENRRTKPDIYTVVEGVVSFKTKTKGQGVEEPIQILTVGSGGKKVDNFTAIPRNMRGLFDVREISLASRYSL